MQEEVENRTLTLVVSGTKFTGRLLKAAISKYMAHRKEKKLKNQRMEELLPLLYIIVERILLMKILKEYGRSSTRLIKREQENMEVME